MRHAAACLREETSEVLHHNDNGSELADRHRSRIAAATNDVSQTADLAEFAEHYSLKAFA